MLQETISTIIQAQDKIDMSYAALSSIMAEISDTALRNVETSQLNYIEKRLYDLDSILLELTTVNKLPKLHD